MKRLIFAGLVLFFFSCVPWKNFDEFDPSVLQHPDEQAIGRAEVSLRQASERKDIEGILSHYTEDAKIMTGGGNPVVVSKEEYKKMLPERFKAEGSYKVIARTAPTIKLLGPDRAEVKQVTQIKVKMFHDVVTKRVYIKTQDGRWLIKKSTYTF